MADSSLELVQHPARATWEFLYETTDQLRAAGQGEIGKCLVLPFQGSPGPVVCVRQTPEPAVLEEAPPRSQTGVWESREGAWTDPCLQAASIQLLPDGADALAALHRMILEARSRIDVIMFLWEDDVVGQAVAAWLAARAGPQLRVRVLVDGGGNLMFGYRTGTSAGEVNRVVAALAKQPNVEVLRTHNAFARFDHRKLVLVDGQAAWTGGRNFVQRSFFEQHDLSFTVRGPLVADLQQRFDCHWGEQGGEAVGSEQWAVGSEQWASPPTNAWARLLETEPARHELEQALYGAVDRAKHHVYMENVYFNDSRLVYRLAQARRRGADVRVVLTIASTNPVINRANRAVANRLRKAGVHVYLYPGMMHMKAGTVDGCWAYLGTGNFDALSLRHNRETGLAIEAGPVIEELEETVLLADCRAEWELRQPLPVSLADYAWELLASWYL